jgi:hypothetical protein
MSIIGVAALVVNGGVAVMFYPFRTGDVNMIHALHTAILVFAIDLRYWIASK